MNVTINARHCDIPETLREATERRVTRLGRYNPKLADAEVTYEVERVTHEVEIRLAVDGEPPVVARASGSDFLGALGRGIDRASRQLRRIRLRRIGAPQTPRA
jgi:ribosomal subunit interface protein